MTTRWRYDSLGQPIGEDQIVAGTIRTLGFTHDTAGHRASILYPSQLSLSTTSTALGQLAAISDGSDPLGAYAYLGQQLALRQAGPFEGKSTYDSSGRLIDRRAATAMGSVLAHESIERNPRGFARSTTRWDLAGAGWGYSYDEAGRVTQVDAQGAEWPGLADSFHYTVDGAQNLTEILSTSSLSACGETTSSTSTIDIGAGNRPSKLTTDGAESILEFDARGNLITKGDLRFTYDGDDRLTKIRHSDDTVLASYAYDALGRRTQRVTGGRTFHTVWDGRQAIEEIEVVGGQDVVQSRRVYGPGLDEVVRLEQRLGATLESYFPFYDSIGNLIAVTDDQGAIIERYLYSPLGERIVWVDDTPPVVEQIRLEDGSIVLEMSEPVQRQRLVEGFDATLRRTTDSTYFAVSVTTPVTTGRHASKRIVLTPLDSEGDLVESDPLELHIPATSLVDRFGQSIAADLDRVISWASTGSVLLEDTTPPRLEEICISGDRTLKVTLNELADVASATTALQIDGAATTWTADASGYVLTSPPLDAGDHTLALETTALDLAGLGLATAESHPITAADGQIATIFESPGPNLLAESTIGNRLGFHGLPRDPETGLLYVRNRYYDPELGRFLTEDPLGYIDGPNLYQFALNNPVAYSDPMGLYAGYEALTEQQKAIAADQMSVEQWQQFDAVSGVAHRSAATVGVVGVSLVGGPVAVGASLTGLWGINTYGRYEELAATEQNPSFGNALALGFYDLTPVNPALELYYGYSLGSGEQLGAFSQGMNVLGVVPALTGFVRGARAARGGYATRRQSRVPPEFQHPHPYRMYRDALRPYKSGRFTKVGRALTKHPNIVGARTAQEVTQRFGNQTGINRAAADALKHIMRNGVVVTKPHTVFRWVTEFKLPNGLGARFNAETYEFIGFLGEAVK